MKIIVFGANGRQGSRLVTEALDRGHQVTAAVRAEDRAGNVDPRADVVVSDALDPARVAAVAVGHDAAINATRERHADVARALLEGLARAGLKRLVIVGGASLARGRAGRAPPRHTRLPGGVQARGGERRRVARRLPRGRPRVEWTYVSPGEVLAPGERTGRYRTGTEQLLVTDDGRSAISMEDFAVALLDERAPRHRTSGSRPRGGGVEPAEPASSRAAAS